MASHLGNRYCSLFALLLSYLLLSHHINIVSAQSVPRNTSLSSNDDAEDPARSRRLASVMAASNGQDDYTCGPGKPCVNGACCGEDGWCGYSPTYCGDGCQSNCDAKAECGRYAATPGTGCPLNVCCSEHGFCGTTAEYCSDGCQSNCETPNPNAAPSNPQDIIIGYWEAWNMDKPCGTMGPGEIPVHLLTHLFVSFGYINDAWEVTNMDGIDPEIFKTIGNVKLRNPDLKVVIALGGWAFNDPGPWRDIFPTLASTKANRATFIANLLGFMSEYGYDGVDFDWEYPGAKDRGGADGDGENYTALLKELREAINASGREYIVTFTAPSSYWYLRHFDLKAMEAHVDWINLMSYDLHGVWDSENPIGSQVLSHTNLTEIDLALELFWRVGIDPFNVVLGLGFYGRSFELTSSSCWKPGCRFEGPGAEGPCSRAPGILSYKEIMDILERTGGTPYFDEVAAAKYMVYDGHSWISFDDVDTFQLKIEYASSMGLRGLMIWAIDLDTGTLQALRAVTGSTLVPGSNSPFSLVDLEHLFPPDVLPPDDAPTNWGLINFGTNANTGAVDPNETGFGFILVVGESHALSSLKKRKDKPEPLVFLDCPPNVKRQPKDKVQTARVVCLSQDVEGCFQVMERGIHGTVVEMPDNCAPNSFVRAISLEKSEDQGMPMIKGRRAPTSDVFDFSFDLDTKQKRQDAGEFIVRVDYSNTKGYWNAAVDSPGVESDSAAKRYWSPSNSNWRDMYQASVGDFDVSYDDRDISETFDVPIYWDTAKGCEVDDEEYELGFGSHVEGSFNAEFTYGFSMHFKLDGNEMMVNESNGWIQVNGDADLTFSVGGVGALEMSKSNQGNPSLSQFGRKIGEGHSIEAGPSGSIVTFQPYWSLEYSMGAFLGSEGSGGGTSGPDFSGQLQTRVKTDFGGSLFNFPISPNDTAGSRNDLRKRNEISVPEAHNTLFSASGVGGRVMMGALLTFGLDIKFEVFGDLVSRTIDLLDMKTHYQSMSLHKFYPSSDVADDSCINTEMATVGWQDYMLDDDNTLNWTKPEHPEYSIQDFQVPIDGEECSPNTSPFGSVVLPGQELKPEFMLPDETGESFRPDRKNVFTCTNCVQCGGDRENMGPCCGCVNMDLSKGYSDIPSCPSCNPDDGSWPGDLSDVDTLNVDDDESLDQRSGLGLEKRVSGEATMSDKKVTICPAAGETTQYWVTGDLAYPAFPAPHDNPWDDIEQGRWKDISTYWGNTSDTCSDWSTASRTDHDTALIGDASGIKKVRAKYQTEHVFEGQVIGDFFTMWLDKGYIKNQEPPSSNPQPKVPCSLIRKYILEIQGWDWHHDDDDEEVPFIDLVLAELGNASRLKRLTILKARPNRMKGTMFTGNQPISQATFKSMTPDEQLASVKEMGMVFTYMNSAEVWAAFCGTYEAISTLLESFDDLYKDTEEAESGIAIPSLQAEWRDYMETVLTSLVKRTRKSYDWYHTTAMGMLASTPANQAAFGIHWTTNNLYNRKLIQISGTCPNLGSITA